MALFVSASFLLLEVIVALFYSYFLEWCLHKIIHNRKIIPFAFRNHFGIHHRNARRNKMYDKNYENILSKESLFEPVSLLFLAIIHLPLIYISYVVYFTLLFSMSMYYYKHRRCHIDVGWGIKNMPWHYEHHMGKDQNKNWGVRTNMIDKIFKTKTDYKSLHTRK